MNRPLSNCPVCSGEIYVSEVSCEACGTQVHGKFATCQYCKLIPEQLQFVQVFLRNRGNISGVGEELGISYPTVTKRLDGILAALGLSAAKPEPIAELTLTAPEPASSPDHRRRAILEMLDQGEITAEEATRELSAL